MEQVVYGREYTLRADITHPDGKKELAFFHGKNRLHVFTNDYRMTWQIFQYMATTAIEFMPMISLSIVGEQKGQLFALQNLMEIS